MRTLILVIGIGLLAADVAHAFNCPADNTPITGPTHLCLPGDWDPTPGPSYQSPQCFGYPAPAGAQAQAIQSAFDAAYTNAPYLVADLCRLKQIFIIGNPPNAGKWENPNLPAVAGNPGSGDAYIAISARDLTASMADSQQQRLKDTKKGGLASHDYNGSANTSKTLSVLYTLAHELGHIKWRRDYSNFTPGCSLANFMAISWMNPFDALTYVTGGDYRWTEFSTETSHSGHPFGIRKANIFAPSQVQTAQHLASNIYGMGMPTLLGAANPEEDFVETYSLKAVMMASPNFKVRIIPNGMTPINVNDESRHSDLKLKFDCVSKLLGP